MQVLATIPPARDPRTLQGVNGTREMTFRAPVSFEGRMPWTGTRRAAVVRGPSRRTEARLFMMAHPDAPSREHSAKRKHGGPPSRQARPPDPADMHLRSRCSSRGIRRRGWAKSVRDRSREPLRLQGLRPGESRVFRGRKPERGLTWEGTVCRRASRGLAASDLRRRPDRHQHRARITHPAARRACGSSSSDRTDPRGRRLSFISGTPPIRSPGRTRRLRRGR